MKMGKAICLCGVICFALGVAGQTAEPPAKRGTVPVQALVEGKSGEIAYDLSASDFSVRDNGVEQQVQLESATAPPPRSVLLVVQTGRNAAAQLGKIERLDNLLDSILTSPRDQVALLTFDSRPHLIQGFTVSSDAISHSLASIRPGDTDAALFDALHTAVAMFDKAPAESRRIILLISGEHDHGSIAPSAALLIQSISLADVSVYGLTFTAPRKELLARMWSMNPLAMTSNAMQRNAAETLAQLTGGDFYHFDSERSFEERVGDVANHIHNSYFLTFQPHDLVPGFHSLQVSVLRSKTDVVAARSGYWFSAADEANSEAKPQ
jgi:VWFA-related protein